MHYRIEIRVYEVHGPEDQRLVDNIAIASGATRSEAHAIHSNILAEFAPWHKPIKARVRKGRPA